MDRAADDVTRGAVVDSTAGEVTRGAVIDRPGGEATRAVADSPGGEATLAAFVDTAEAASAFNMSSPSDASTITAGVRGSAANVFDSVENGVCGPPNSARGNFGPLGGADGALLRDGSDISGHADRFAADVDELSGGGNEPLDATLLGTDDELAGRGNELLDVTLLGGDDELAGRDNELLDATLLGGDDELAGRGNELLDATLLGGDDVGLLRSSDPAAGGALGDLLRSGDPGGGGGRLGAFVRPGTPLCGCVDRASASRAITWLPVVVLARAGTMGCCPVGLPRPITACGPVVVLVRPTPGCCPVDARPTIGSCPVGLARPIAG